LVDDDILRLHHAASAQPSVIVGVSRPGSSDGNVENKVKRAVAQSSPFRLVANQRARDLVELHFVQVPGDGLGLPASRRAVKVQTPGMPRVVGDRDGLLISVERAAVATVTAVRRAVGEVLAVHLLHDVELTALRPGHVRGAARVAKEPEGGPDALLVGGGVAADSELGLGASLLARSRGEGVNTLNTTRCPFRAVRVAAVLGNQLQGLATAELHVVNVVRVSLQLAVLAEIFVDNGPFGCIGASVGAAREIVIPHETEARI
jgi:hypothetical protein